jgi:hypothetical protein
MKSFHDGLSSLVRGMAVDTKAFVAKAIADALAPLEARIAALEAREYQGTWKAEQRYSKGAMVTFDGSVWVARSASMAVRPGTGPTWQLCVKRGRDGKDSRDER